MKYKSLVCLIVAFALTGCAAGLDGPIPDSAAAPVAVVACGTPSILVADADRNGRISRDEAERDERLGPAFDSYDADRDGQLERGELAAYGERAEQAEFARLESGPGDDVPSDCYQDY